MTTPFMNLSLPTPSVTLGPAWASQLNAALAVIDAHDHSNGKGTTIKTAGLELDGDLTFNGFTAFNLKSVKLASQSATLTGLTNAQSLFSYGGDLYWNHSGTPVPITSGGGLVPQAAAMTTMNYTAVASDYTASTVDVLLVVDTNAAREITLPLATSVSTGRIYIIKDGTGLSETNNITIKANPAGSDTIDGQSSIAYGSNYGSIFLVTNAVDRWVIV